jgi:selenocysteine lyase/cysteine desulfurase
MFWKLFTKKCRTNKSKKTRSHRRRKSRKGGTKTITILLGKAELEERKRIKGLFETIQKQNQEIAKSLAKAKEKNPNIKLIGNDRITHLP